MQVYRNLAEYKGRERKPVVALGNFDGLHRGHQFLIRQAVAAAEELGATPAVLTFRTHPMKVLHPKGDFPLLMSLEDKIEGFEKLGVKALFLLDFDESFARIPAQSFLEDILLGNLRAAGIVIGYNYAFGSNGRGNPELLEEYSKKRDFYLQVIPPVSLKGTVVSSSLIRTYISQGKVKEAGDFLGYIPYLKGEVVPGDQRGREIGFPTANIVLPDEIIIPAAGVYAVKISGLGRTYGGVANIGTRPTFLKDNLIKNLEVHIFDLTHEIYGQDIKVEFLSKLRDETTFGSVDALVNQINNDVLQAKRVLESLTWDYGSPNENNPFSCQI